MATEDIALNINMDRIGGNNWLQLYASGLYHYPHLKQSLDNIKATKIKLLYGHEDPNDGDLDDWTFFSDHWIFHNK